jgi:hypothetical protein
VLSCALGLALRKALDLSYKDPENKAARMAPLKAAADRIGMKLGDAHRFEPVLLFDEGKSSIRFGVRTFIGGD